MSGRLRITAMSFAVFFISEICTQQLPEPLVRPMNLGNPTTSNFYLQTGKFGDESSKIYGLLDPSSDTAIRLPPNKTTTENKRLLGYNLFVNSKRENISNKLLGKPIDPYVKTQENLHGNEINPMANNVKGTYLEENPGTYRYSVSGDNIEYTRNENEGTDGKSPLTTFENGHYEDPQGHFQFYRSVQFTNYPSSGYYEDSYFDHGNQIKRQAPPHYYSLAQYPNNRLYEDETSNKNIPILNSSTSRNSISSALSHNQQINPSVVYNPYNNYNQIPQYVPVRTGHGTENSNTYYTPYKNYQRLPYGIPVEFPRTLPEVVSQNQSSLSDYLTFPNKYISLSTHGNKFNSLQIPHHEVNTWPQQSPKKFLTEDQKSEILEQSTEENAIKEIAEETKYKTERGQIYPDSIRNRYKPQDLIFFQQRNPKLYESEVPYLNVSVKDSIIKEEYEPEFYSNMNYRIEPSEMITTAPQETISENVNPTLRGRISNSESLNIENIEDSSSYSKQSDIISPKKWFEKYPRNENLLSTYKFKRVPISKTNSDSGDMNKMIEMSNPIMYSKEVQKAVFPQKFYKLFSDDFSRTSKAIGSKYNTEISTVADNIQDQSLHKRNEGNFNIFPQLQTIKGNSIYSAMNKTFPLFMESWKQNDLLNSDVYIFPVPTAPNQTTVSSIQESSYSSNKINASAEESLYVSNNYIQENASNWQSTKHPARPQEVHISPTYPEETSETTMVTNKNVQPSQESVTEQNSQRVILPTGAKDIVIKLPNGHEIVIDVSQISQNSTKKPSSSNIQAFYPLKLMPDRLESHKRSFSFNQDNLTYGEIIPDSGEASDNVQVVSHKLTPLDNPNATEKPFKSDNTATSSSVFPPIADSSDITLTPTPSVGTTTSTISHSQHFEKDSNSIGYETGSSNLNKDMDDRIESTNTHLYDPNNIVMISLFKDRHEPNIALKNEEDSKTFMKEKVTQVTTPLPGDIQVSSVGLHNFADLENEDFNDENDIAYDEIPSYNHDDFPARSFDMDLPILLASPNNPELVTFETRKGRFFRFSDNGNCKCECI